MNVLRSERPLSGPHRLFGRRCGRHRSRCLNADYRHQVGSGGLRDARAVGGFWGTEPLPRLRRQSGSTPRAAREEPPIALWQQACRVGDASTLIDMNGWSWNPYPSIDESEHAVVSIVSGSGTRSARLSGCKRISLHLTHQSSNPQTQALFLGHGSECPQALQDHHIATECVG